MTPHALLTEAIAVAREAGDAQMRFFRQPSLEVDNKLNDADIVTAADREGERIILERIHRKFPTHAILSEESGAGGASVDAPYRWVVDPLDGTTNFASGLPAFSVSIAIEDSNGEAVAAVVYAPYLNELFTAIRGEGAQLNFNPIQCSACTSLAKAVVATGFPVDKDTSPDNNLDNLQRVLPCVRGIRRLGSAALDLSYVAAGFLDGYWELNLHRWDIAAGALIAKEAGAKFDHLRPVGSRHHCIVSAAPGIFPALAEKLK